MAVASFKYASTVTDWQDRQLLDGQADAIDKDLEGSLGMVVQVSCTYGTGPTGGLVVKVLGGLDGSYDSDDTPAFALELPYISGGTITTTFPVLLPEISPKVRLKVSNDSGTSVTVTVRTKLVESVEIV